MKGKIKFYNNNKNYGFIAGDDGNDYFFHHSEVNEGVALDKDVEVEFETKQGKQGMQAVNVRGL